MNTELTLENIESMINSSLRDLLIKDKEFWQKKDIAKMCGVSLKVVDRMVAQPGFPEGKILKGTTTVKIYRKIDVNRFLGS